MKFIKLLDKTKELILFPPLVHFYKYYTQKNFWIFLDILVKKKLLFDRHLSVKYDKPLIARVFCYEHLYYKSAKSSSLALRHLYLCHWHKLLHLGAWLNQFINDPRTASSKGKSMHYLSQEYLFSDGHYFNEPFKRKSWSSDMRHTVRNY